MKTIRFLVTVVDQRYGQTYECGSVHSLADDSAYHWIKRSKAEEVKTVESTAKPAVEKAQDFDNGNTVESAADVDEQDGGDIGERTEHVVKGRRGRPKKLS